jgi:hypothetical protein
MFSFYNNLALLCSNQFVEERTRGMQLLQRLMQLEIRTWIEGRSDKATKQTKLQSDKAKKRL